MGAEPAVRGWMVRSLVVIGGGSRYAASTNVRDI